MPKALQNEYHYTRKSKTQETIGIILCGFLFSIIFLLMFIFA